jgi:hypothetical protein
MKKVAVRVFLVALTLAVFVAPRSQSQTLPLVATGTLDKTRGGNFADLSGLHYTLENGAPANALGGFGSAITYASGNTFLALPDRGPNAVAFDALIDNTASYVNRFHTVTMSLEPNKNASGLPYMLTPEMRATTLLWSATPLVYGTGANLGVGSGKPPINNFFQHFFTGRSDNFDATQNSGNGNDARFDTEGLRLSNDGLRIYISDEYGPYVYEFDRFTGRRLRSFQLPSSLYVKELSAVGAMEISGNTIGRVANKGMEGLAITPDGKTLVGIMQNTLIQDAADKSVKNAKNFLRIIVMDVKCGCTIHQYGYLLTNGSGVSEILAVNDHQFLVDERDGNGRESGGDDVTKGNAAVVKQLFLIDLDGATDVSGLDTGNMTITQAVAAATPKTLFLDIVASLTSTTLGANAIPATLIPAKIEGITFGPDIREEDCAPDFWDRLWFFHQNKGRNNSNSGKNALHTLWIANDSDFLQMVVDPNGNQIPNPNQFFVFSFTDADLPGFVPQKFEGGFPFLF